MKNWSQEIFAYFDHLVTNAYTEALNGLIQVTNRLERGYSFEMIRAKMLYDDGLVGERSYSYRNSFLSLIMPLDPKEHIPDAPDDTYLRLIGNDLSTLEEALSRVDSDWIPRPKWTDLPAYRTRRFRLVSLLLSRWTRKNTQAGFFFTSLCYTAD